MVPECGYTLLQDPDIARFSYRDGGRGGYNKSTKDTEIPGKALRASEC